MSKSPGSSQSVSQQEIQGLPGPPFLRYAHVKTSKQVQSEELCSVFYNYTLAEVSCSRMKSPKSQYEKLTSKDSF